MEWKTAIKKASAEYNREKKPARKTAAKKRTPAKKVSGVGKVKTSKPKKVTIKAKVVKISGMAGMGAVGYNNCVGEIQKVTVQLQQMADRYRNSSPAAKPSMRNEMKRMRDYRTMLMRQKTQHKRFL